jgi:beta-mannosidase
MKLRRTATGLDFGGEWQFALSPQDHAAASLGDLERAGLALVTGPRPGALETDLQALGKFPEPFAVLNILEAQRYERHHVWYARRFRADVPPGTIPELVFEGIDTCAEIYLNGVHLGGAANMFIAHSFRVGRLLREENELLVHIRPAVVEAEKYEYPAGVGALGLNYESLHLRKAAHMYGWDIMPRAVSAGLWRPVRLEFLPPERLEDVYLFTSGLSADHARADLVLHYGAVLGSGRYEIAVEGACGDAHFEQSKALTFRAGRLRFSVPRPKLWWPRGSGAPDLYNVTVRLLRDGAEIDRVAFTHGIRKIELERTSVTNEKGEGSFLFRVNGEPIFIKGTNWVPADAFHWRDAERIPRILPLILECHCNLVRGWGGGVYEDEPFFDWCDRAGIMVWQDFAMGCALYPQDRDFQQRLAVEARQIVRRLRQHASLILWAGDNECDSAHADSWLAGGDPNDNVLTRRVLPEVLKDEDPTRPYLPSSPYMDKTAYFLGEKYLPENHLWGPRDYYKSEFYLGALCHFASEIGYHGAPNEDSLRRFLSPEKLWPPQGNDEWVLHSTNPKLDESFYAPADYRVNLMINQVRVLFGEVPENLPDFIFASQASQAEAKKFFIERFRTGKEGWRRTGLIWWNLIDGWPQLSDAVIDYYFGKKLAFDFIRRAQTDICVMLREPTEARQDIVAVNDTGEEVAIDYALRDIASGQEIASGRATLPANSAVTVGGIPFDADAQRFYAIAWKSNGVAGANHYLAGRPPFRLEQYRSWLKAAQLP